MKKFIFEIMGQLDCLSGFNTMIDDDKFEVDDLTNTVLNTDATEDEKAEYSLKRSLNHLELIEYFQGCGLGNNTKYFSSDFLTEMESFKHEAQINTINSTRFITKGAA